jgi:hypothetical protein
LENGEGSMPLSGHGGPGAFRYLASAAWIAGSCVSRSVIVGKKTGFAGVTPGQTTLATTTTVAK